MRPILVALILGVLATSLVACEDEYDHTKECGRLGNCCWADKTCNPSERPAVVCDVKTMKCILDKTKLDSGPTADTGPTPDKGPTADTGPTPDKGSTQDSAGGDTAPKADSAAD